MYFGEKLLVCKDCYTKNTARSTRNSATYTRMKAQTPRMRTTDKVQHSRVAGLDLANDYQRAVKEAREKMGLTIHDLAARIGVRESIMRRIENGKFVPDEELIKRLEKFLRIKILVPDESSDSLTLPGLQKEGLELRHVAKLKHGED
ncbi:MAG: multiprotein-bridging factor 1 family protein [Candidatus Marsarchaeota archaeon]|nr:multiprotein-bridging factor 1 family protein [Candidatus Marsarchaeota archaeon]